MTVSRSAFGLLGGLLLLSATTEAAPKKPKVEATSEFDRQAAAASISDIALQKCKATNAAVGDGHVTITFAPSGSAQQVTIDRGPWVGTPVAKCMTREFKKARVPAFRGEAVTVGKSFHFA